MYSTDAGPKRLLNYYMWWCDLQCMVSIMIFLKLRAFTYQQKSAYVHYMMIVPYTMYITRWWRLNNGKWNHMYCVLYWILFQPDSALDGKVTTMNSKKFNYLTLWLYREHCNRKKGVTYEYMHFKNILILQISLNYKRQCPSELLVFLDDTKKKQKQ